MNDARFFNDEPFLDDEGADLWGVRSTPGTPWNCWDVSAPRPRPAFWP
ncbi:hypothetical protein ACFWA6_05505 [Streptomyces sp. NPDC060020]